MLEDKGAWKVLLCLTPQMTQVLVRFAQRTLSIATLVGDQGDEVPEEEEPVLDEE